MNLLTVNATGNITGSWIPHGGTRLVSNRVHFYIEGTHGGATYTLRWRPKGSLGNGMVICQYTAPATDVMQSFDVGPGDLQVQVAGGSGVNAMPVLVY